jgi:hypothetical protein
VYARAAPAIRKTRRYPMPSKKKLWLIGIGVVFYTAAIVWLGMGFGMRSSVRRVGIEIDNTQAMLAFNRVLKERKLALLLSKGCVAAAAKEIDIALDQDTKLLSSLFKGELSPWVSKYVNDRDQNFLKSLETFKSKYGDSWKEPDCT